MFFPALLAKLLSAGALAQAATGAGVVVVAFTGAGVAGVLPGPVQDTFTTVVANETSEVTTPPADTTTGIETPATETVDPAAVEDPAAVTQAAVTPAEESATGLTFEQWKQGPATDQSFGQWVSAGARLGYVDGKTVSEWAHKRHEDRRTGSTATTPAGPVTAEQEAGDDDRIPEEVQHEDGSRSDGGGSGHGNGRN